MADFENSEVIGEHYGHVDKFYGRYYMQWKL